MQETIPRRLADEHCTVLPLPSLLSCDQPLRAPPPSLTPFANERRRSSRGAGEPRPGFRRGSSGQLFVRRCPCCVGRSSCIRWARQRAAADTPHARRRRLEE